MVKLTRYLALTALALAAASCGSAVRQGSSPVYLVIDSLQGARGGKTPGPLGNVVPSDVITNVTSPDPCTASNPCPTVFSDSGQVVLRASLKDIGAPGSPTTPTANNDVTITRYHVSYQRADGRNVEGVDVPYRFDGGATGTIAGTGTLSLGFELVRSVAKQESPLIQLTTNPTVLGTIANVTFYGFDQAGNQISVTGSLTVDFANFGD